MTPLGSGPACGEPRHPPDAAHLNQVTFYQAGSWIVPPQVWRLVGHHPQDDGQDHSDGDGTEDDLGPVDPPP